MYNLCISGYCTTTVQLVSHPQSVVTLITAPISSEKNGMVNPTSLDKLPRKGGRCFALTSKFDDKTKTRWNEREERREGRSSGSGEKWPKGGYSKHRKLRQHSIHGFHQRPDGVCHEFFLWVAVGPCRHVLSPSLLT